MDAENHISVLPVEAITTCHAGFRLECDGGVVCETSSDRSALRADVFVIWTYAIVRHLRRIGGELTCVFARGGEASDIVARNA